MPTTNQMLESKYLKQSDLSSGPVRWTCAGVERANIAREGAAADYKWLLHFRESQKPLVLNNVNIQLAEQAFGSGDTDDWQGQAIVLYVDPNVMYQGKLVGGIRLRAPKVPSASAPPSKPLSQRPAQRAPQPPADDADQDLGF